MQHYQFLADALKDYTKTKRPDQDAAKLLDHIKKTHPKATHAVLCANTDINSPIFGAYLVIPVGPGQAYEKIEDVENSYIIDKSEMQRYPVAYVELKK
jgi:hypothetical protein